MDLFIMQCAPVSCNLLSRLLEYVPHSPIFKLPHSIFFLNVRHHVSHPYKTTSKAVNQVVASQKCLRYVGLFYSVWTGPT